MGSATGSGIASGAGKGASAGFAVGGPWGAAIGAVIGGVVGGIGGAGVDRAKTALKNTIAEYMNQLQALDMPRYEDLKLTFEKYSRGEPLTTEELTALQDVNSEVSKLTQDKVAKQSQLEALAAIKERARGGLTLQDKADLLNAQREIDRQSSGIQKSIINNMAARGQAGSGAELAARLGASQQSAQLASQNALNIAGNAQNRAYQAIKDSASLGRQIGQDQLDFDAMKAKAADETRRSNLERLQATMQYNVGNKNFANAANFQRANQVADKNVALSNEEQAKNKSILWDDYLNQRGHLQEKYLGQFGAIGQKQAGVKEANDEANAYGEYLNEAGNLLGSFGGGGAKPSAGGSSGGGIPGFQSKMGGGNWSFD